jgi:hypothetical protein
VPVHDEEAVLRVRLPARDEVDQIGGRDIARHEPFGIAERDAERALDLVERNSSDTVSCPG